MKMLCIMLPITKREKRELGNEAAVLAFHRDEKLASEGLRPSESVGGNCIHSSGQHKQQLFGSILTACQNATDQVFLYIDRSRDYDGNYICQGGFIPA